MQSAFNPKTKLYEIVDFNGTLNEIKDFISKNSFTNLVIQDDSDKATVKKARTAIRKKKDDVKKLRLNVNEAMLGAFNRQTKQIESLLDEADLKMKELIDNYENKVITKKFTIVVSSTDEQVIEKIKAFALEQKNVEVK